MKWSGRKASQEKFQSGEISVRRKVGVAVEMLNFMWMLAWICLNYSFVFIIVSLWYSEYLHVYNPMWVFLPHHKHLMLIRNQLFTWEWRKLIPRNPANKPLVDEKYCLYYHLAQEFRKESFILLKFDVAVTLFFFKNQRNCVFMVLVPVLQNCSIKNFCPYFGEVIL